MPFLLERLAMRPDPIDGRTEAFDEIAAIQAQVQRLFASRSLQNVGASALLEWGLPNVVEMGAADMPSLCRYAEQARRAIAKHEPRLENVRVTVEPQENVLTPFRLQVTAVLSSSQDACCFGISLAR